MTPNPIMATRILRDFRHMAPGPFHTLNQKIRKGLTDNANIPDSIWSGNATLLPSYFAASSKHDEAYHRALYSGKLDLAERDLLQAQVVDLLDEIAMILEAAAFYNPSILITSGFNLAKERRSRPRTKVPSPGDLKASEEPPAAG